MLMKEFIDKLNQEIEDAFLHKETYQDNIKYLLEHEGTLAHLEIMQLMSQAQRAVHLDRELEVTKENIQPFIKFLANRFDALKKTPANPVDCPFTAASLISLKLAVLITKALGGPDKPTALKLLVPTLVESYPDYKVMYQSKLNDDHSALIPMEGKPDFYNAYGNEGNKRLIAVIFKNKEDLLKYLAEFSGEEQKKILSNFDLEALSSLIFGLRATSPYFEMFFYNELSIQLKNITQPSATVLNLMENFCQKWFKERENDLVGLVNKLNFHFLKTKWFPDFNKRIQPLIGDVNLIIKQIKNYVTSLNELLRVLQLVPEIVRGDFLRIFEFNELTKILIKNPRSDDFKVNLYLALKDALPLYGQEPNLAIYCYNRLCLRWLASFKESPTAYLEQLNFHFLNRECSDAILKPFYQNIVDDIINEKMLVAKLKPIIMQVKEMVAALKILTASGWEKFLNNFDKNEFCRLLLNEVPSEDRFDELFKEKLTSNVEGKTEEDRRVILFLYNRLYNVCRPEQKDYKRKLLGIRVGCSMQIKLIASKLVNAFLVSGLSFQQFNTFYENYVADPKNNIDVYTKANLDRALTTGVMGIIVGYIRSPIPAPVLESSVKFAC